MKKITFYFILIAVTIMMTSNGNAQTAYKQPVKEVADIMNTASFLPFMHISPTGKHILVLNGEIYPSISEYAKDVIPLAGMRVYINEKRHSRRFFFNTLSLIDCRSGTAVALDFPSSLFLDSATWSPNGEYFAFTVDSDKGQQLWLGDIHTKSVKKINTYLSDILADGFSWASNDTILLHQTVPGSAPVAPRVPQGPVIEENYGVAKKSRTYQNLLQNDFDASCFEYYGTTQIALYDVKSGKISHIGAPGLYNDASLSPDGNYFLVSKIERPFSYSVPHYLFPRVYEIWDKTGKRVKVLFRKPLAENVPFEGVPTGPRNVVWAPNHDGRIVWLEALDGGDSAAEAELRDRLCFLDAPFTSRPTIAGDMKERIVNISFFDSPDRVMLRTVNRKARWTTTFVRELKENGNTFAPLFSHNQQDAYNDPGNIVTVFNQRARKVIKQDGDFIYLSSDGSSPEGDFPYLAKFHMETGEKEVLFQSRKNGYDFFIRFADANHIIIWKENPIEHHNLYRKNLTDGTETQLTFFQDPFPELRKIKMEMVTYKRYDGVELSGKLYLPSNYKQGDKLPLLIWAYPYEYTDPSVAGQIRGSKYRFVVFRGASSVLFATQGYAVLDAASMPIIGDPDRKNDSFVQQITGSAKAAIDYLDERGIIDRKKVVVGGHSYGAFMTANLLAHSDLFAAGIARSGAYNRTLTPFGFQDERRTFWQARDVYINMSPFTYADKIKTPILLIHGMEDANSGTFPIQSYRFYEALKANGADCRLVKLPLEDHSYKGKESILHVMAEMLEWADKYTK